jgi:hypothetical protein
VRVVVCVRVNFTATKNKQKPQTSINPFNPPRARTNGGGSEAPRERRKEKKREEKKKRNTQNTQTHCTICIQIYMYNEFFYGLKGRRDCVRPTVGMLDCLVVWLGFSTESLFENVNQKIIHAFLPYVT